jgi:hypothetical protein
MKDPQIIEPRRTLPRRTGVLQGHLAHKKQPHPLRTTIGP